MPLTVAARCHEPAIWVLQLDGTCGTCRLFKLASQPTTHTYRQTNSVVSHIHISDMQRAITKYEQAQSKSFLGTSTQHKTHNRESGTQCPNEDNKQVTHRQQGSTQGQVWINIVLLIYSLDRAREYTALAPICWWPWCFPKSPGHLPLRSLLGIQGLPSNIYDFYLGDICIITKLPLPYPMRLLGARLD